MKIGILGTAHTFHQAPFNDASWELWACNLGEPPRWDRWFQLHDDATIDGNPGHREWLAAQTKPVYLQRAAPSIPAGIRYPMPEMAAKYGTWFFTSSIAFMLAKALEEIDAANPAPGSPPHEIGLWGVEMADVSEYMGQKNGCRFFLQLARMRGIRLVMPPECELLVPGKIYGFDTPSWLETKVTARHGELSARMQQVDGHRTRLMLEKASLMGARDIVLSPEQVTARLAQVDVELGTIEREALVLDGAVQDIAHIRANWLGATP